ncbi:hypothetical protein Cni_G03164 [Canna indica]|uniref:(S)-ureidoglycine aminohydrolase cupin domain-containing protein n=1 Tax=Canna indica TaxID=4628 RepID=A0AAQ3Q3A7_9LILI|nr:hypothetical protein Cni_G03164 [Canna indica]
MTTSFSLSAAALLPPTSVAPPKFLPSRRLPAFSSSVSSSGIYARFEPPLEVYNVRVECGLSKERLAQPAVDQWSVWKTGACCLPWDWHVDKLVYVVNGEVRVVPNGAKTGECFMCFVAGDLV